MHADEPRATDLLAAALGGLAFLLLLLSPWLVDTEGPDPFYKGPLIFPLLALSLMALSALPAFRRLAQRRDRRPWLEPGARAPRTGGAIFVLVVLIPFGITWAGLEPTAVLFAAGGLLLAGERRWPMLLALPAGLSLAVHVAFKRLLDIWLPPPALLEMLQRAAGS